MSAELLCVDLEDGFATITLKRPPLNILNRAMLAELDAALESAFSSQTLAALLIAAEGRAFSAGVDIADHTADKAADMIRLFHGIFRKLAATDAVTISAVQGAALGGGCELACFCDIVLASDAAKFGQPEIQVGVFPPVAACAFPLRVGVARTVELITTGVTIDAATAQRIGLVNQVYPAESFAARVEEYMAGLRKLSRPVVRLTKRAATLPARQALLAHLDQVEKLYLDELMVLSDAHEGIAAFTEKRPPVWKHA
jgi:cyclohexa-1,5-dienecarbonyl-CoA hydratase